MKALVIEALHRQGKLPYLNVSAQGSGADIQVPAGLASGLLPCPVHLVGFADEEGIRFR